MKELTYKANDVLKKLFDDAGLILVDFKLEFGLYKGEVVLGDEFSPDGSRLWDKETLEKMDKDRFRQSLGGLIEAYEAVARRLVKALSDQACQEMDSKATIAPANSEYAKRLTTIAKIGRAHV